MPCSSSRLTRICTGWPVFFASSAGMMSVTDPVPLLPYPPPQYSLMSTMSSGFRSSHRLTDITVCTVLCVERWMNSLPFCQ